ncbi:EI24 domain-containing protein [Litoreibacter arenae]|uniref:Membrane protein n=1 Tax=Litoreibacter arenae DSM 19593 TaxID=1123360 RepID=S9RTY1_9RHOB|nr:EI24 domain-containing protein [Litoreibacter arenae]EPX81515.1 membrane protein [Litoreibacter arenae DSM 19593]
MIFTDFFKALGQIGDGRFLKVLLGGVGLTIALLFAFTVAFAWTVGFVVPDTFTLPWIGEITWIDNVLSWAVVPVMIVASVFLMVPVASAFTGLFLDQVVDAVEAEHYPQEPAVSPLPLSESIAESAKFLGVIVAVNAVALVLYMIFPPFAPLIFWGVNGLLLGREYAMLVAQRRLGVVGAREFLKRNRAQIWMAGTLMAIPLTIPFVNLLIPILGVASFTHLYHRLAR